MEGMGGEGRLKGGGQVDLRCGRRSRLQAAPTADERANCTAYGYEVGGGSVGG
jgi:hypothetical protein